MLGEIQKALIDPDGFFEDRMSEPQWVSAFLIVVTYLLLTLVVAPPLMPRFDVDSLINHGDGLFSALVTHEIREIAGLLLLAVTFHGISFVYTRDGPFVRTVIFVAWGLLPMIAATVVMAVGVLIATQGLQTVALIQFPVQLSTIKQQVWNGPFVFQIRITAYALALWSVYMWVYAIKHTRNLSTRQATISVGGPIVLIVVLSHFLGW